MSGKHRIDKRAAVSKTFKEFLSDITKFVNVGKRAEDVEALTKSVRSGVKSFDDILANLPVKRSKNGIVSIGDTTVGAVRKLAREGNLSELAKLSKVAVNVTESEKRAFSKLSALTPEAKYKEIVDSASATKLAHPELNVTINDISSLSNAAKGNVNKISDNLLKKFKTGTVIALTIGAVYVGVDWIAKTTEARKGCYMLTTINGKTTSCKVAAYSCSNPTGGSLCSGSQKYYNNTILLLVISKLPDTDTIKINLAKALNIDVSEVSKSLKRIIDEKFDVVNDFLSVEANRTNKVGICSEKSGDVEGGIIPDCRMCTPSANPTSTQFIDPSQYPDNVTFQCVTNPSILDTITDAAISTGADLWDGVSKKFNIPVKKIAISLIVATLLLLILWFVSKFAFRPKAQNLNAKGFVQIT